MKKSRPVLAAVAQMNSRADVGANLEQAATLIKAAVKRGARWVLLPENFAYFGPDEGRFAVSERLSGAGPILSVCRGWAREYGIELVLGGFPERALAGKTYNAAVHIAADGRIAAKYRKIHLFDVMLPDGTCLMESATVCGGKSAVVSPSAFGPLGLSICYDVRFPELYRVLVKRGAVALAVPAAFTAQTGRAHWHTLLRARAIESQAYVLAAAQWGRHYGARRSYGHALILDPWGRVLDECKSGIGIALAAIDPAEAARVREEFPALKHRRLG